MEQRWRVSRVDRTRAVVVPEIADAARDEGDDGAAHVQPPRTVPLRPGGLLPMTVGEPVQPAVGDRAVTPADEPDHVLLLPRTSALTRASADRSSLTQVLAANIDLVIVAEPLDPEPKLGRIERLAALAWNCGAQPLVVLTKADLAADGEHWLKDAERLDVAALLASGATGQGIEELRARIVPGTTTVIVGPSGAGKSTLVNALVGAAVMAAGPRRESDGKGRHTTTHRELVRIGVADGQAWLVDTPGLRAVGLVGDVDSIASTFRDVADLARDCRFADCSHTSEPGCAVLAALADGTLERRRYDAWQAHRREAAHQARREGDRLALAEHAEVIRRRSRAIREYHRVTGKGRR